MKKAILVILIILSCSQVFALTNFYMAPYGAAVVNLNTPEWKTELESKDGDGNRYFPSNRILFIGGMDGLESGFHLEDWEIHFGELSNYEIHLELDSATWDGEYFWFTKQSDPEFVCPFRIQVGLFYHTEVNYINPREGYANLGVYEPETVAGKNMMKLSADTIDWLGILGSAFGTATGYLVFEFGIILPYDLENNTLKMEGGETYPLASGDDYSAEITVTATLVDSRNNNTLVNNPMGANPIVFTLPISGYYDAKSEIKPPETSASLFVDAYSRAANLDLLNNQGEDSPIGSVDFSVYGLDPVETDANGNYAHTYDDSVFLFLSASPNPYVQDTAGFRFIHDDVGFGDAITASNSIGYTIQCVPTEDITSVDGSLTAVEFDGTDYLSDANGVVTPPENKRVKTAHFQQSLGELVGGYEHWHSYNGELILTLDENPTIMQSGLYRSNVYVHVVTDDSLGGN